MRRNSIVLLVVSMAALLSVVIGAYQIDGVRWRANVLMLKAGGQLRSIAWSELLALLGPESDIYLRDLIDHPNAYAVIRNPHNSAKDLQEGERLYESQCMHCHGAAGNGGTAPNIVSGVLRGGDSDWAVFRTLKDGVQGTAMAPANLPDVDRWRVTGYLLSLRQSSNSEKAGIAKSPLQISVPYERITSAASEPHNWLTYSGDYNGQRHTSLNGIRRATVRNLSLSWVLQAEVKERIEASPIVVDGVMYLSLPEGVVLALDAKSGEQYWRWDSAVEESLPVCCGRVNRGVAILDDKVFATTLDNKLQCLDAENGDLLWERKVADSKEGYTITVAPLAVKDKVIVGVSGGEYGIRGFLDAYDSTSGEHTWRFYTIPEPGQPGGETWTGDSWRTGGGPTWVTGSYDPSLGLVYWGVGNPSPDFDGSTRGGDNLYTNSVIALDIATGDLRWFFQFTPHDLHDYDSNQVPVLVDRHFNGRDQSLMLWANRNGFFYVLDRVTGNYLGSIPFARQTWASGIDESGRPVKAPGATPSPKGTIIWPGTSGATSWAPPSFSPVTGLFYVPRLNRPSVFFRNEELDDREPGELWLGGTSALVPDSSETSVVAVDPQGPSIVWERSLNNAGGLGRFSGVLTMPELVIVGESKLVSALDAASGEVVWSSRLGGEVGSPPISFAVDGTQYMTIAAGKNIYTFGIKTTE